MTPAALAWMIDHTFLKPFGLPVDIERLCDEAWTYHFAAVGVNPAEVERCVGLLSNSGVKVAAGVGFPLGQNTSRIKILEARDAIDHGAAEIDMVINLRALQAGQAQYVGQEIRELVRACSPAGVITKIILETGYLSDAEKRLGCQIAREEGADFVKTCTGFAPGGATPEDVALLRQTVGPGMGVKASGGIRTLAAALAMVEAGATRLGTSAGPAILEAMRARD